MEKSTHHAKVKPYEAIGFVFVEWFQKYSFPSGFNPLHRI